MRREFAKTIFLLIGLLLIGGCVVSQKKIDAKQTASNTTTTAQDVIKKKPAIIPKPDSHDHCENNGFELIIRFDQLSQSSKAFCRFTDTTECDVEEFFQGKCGPGSGSTIYHPNISPKVDTSVCTNDYQPICGQDNTTYTNSCWAQTQGIVIDHIGVCAEQAETKPATNANQSIKESGKTEPQTDQPIDWLPLITSFILASPPTQPAASVSKCTYGGKTLYLQSSGGINNFSILYNQDGSVLCYPYNDLDNACLTDQKYWAKNCSIIWQDKR